VGFFVSQCEPIKGESLGLAQWTSAFPTGGPLYGESSGPLRPSGGVLDLAGKLFPSWYARGRAIGCSAFCHHVFDKLTGLMASLREFFRRRRPRNPIVLVWFGFLPGPLFPSKWTVESASFFRGSENSYLNLPAFDFSLRGIHALKGVVPLSQNLGDLVL